MPETSVQLTVHQKPWVFLKWSSCGPLCILMAGMSLLQVQDLAFAISETHEVLFSPLLQPVEALVNGSPVLKHIHPVTHVLVN